jgi:hypothetical protein
VGSEVIEGSSANRQLLSGFFENRIAVDSTRGNRGHNQVQRRYTEDWVLHRGYQQHRHTSSSRHSESSQSQTLEELEVGRPESGVDGDEEDGGLTTGRHCRNISNATITPADFRHEGLHTAVQDFEPSSDRESGNSALTGRAGKYKTAPQSLVDFAVDCKIDLPKMPGLPSRWADSTPSPIEESAMNGFKMSLPTPTDTAAKPGLKPGLKESDESLHESPHGLSNNNNLLPVIPLSVQSSRAGSPNPRRVIKWNGRNVIIQIPKDVPFGRPAEEGGRPYPLTPNEVVDRMQGWVDKGYSLEFGGEGSCRDIYPEEQKGKVDSSEIFISIPDRRGMLVFFCLEDKLSWRVIE